MPPSTLRRLAAGALYTVAAALGWVACGPSEQAETLEPCPDRERMYRDHSLDGSPCRCIDSETYVLDNTQTKCIECLGDCSSKSCGDDGCGRICGDCPLGYECDTSSYACAPCQPNCDGRECGDDGCGGLCGTCNQGQSCEGGQCISGQTGGSNICCTLYGQCPLPAYGQAGLPCYCVDFYGYTYQGYVCEL